MDRRNPALCAVLATVLGSPTARHLAPVLALAAAGVLLGASPTRAAQAVFPGSQGPCVPYWLPGGGGAPGASGSSTPPSISALLGLDQKGGLVVGGSFVAIGGTPANNVARWDGNQWSNLGPGIPSPVNDLELFDDGLGAELYAAATLGQVAGGFVRWTGNEWVAPAGGYVPGAVRALQLSDEPSGPALYLGGGFTNAGGVAASRVARWNGVTMQPLGSGMNAEVRALCVHDEGNGPVLFAGGSFTLAGGTPVSRIARWDGSQWTPVGSGFNGAVFALASLQLDGESALYAAGSFSNVGGVIGENFIARWYQGSWSSVGGGVDGIVHSLLAVDDGLETALYLGGLFQSAGGSPASGVARWDGASYSALGDGVSGGTDAGTLALARWTEAGAPALVVGGRFEEAGGKSAKGVALWSEGNWEIFGDGLNGSVRDALRFDDGSGEAIFVIGGFQGAGGVALNHVARFDGQHWSPLGSGLTVGPVTIPEFPVGAAGSVTAMLVREEPDGSALYVGGSITSAGGVPAQGVARWDGTSWSALGEGVPGLVTCLAEYDDGSGPALYAGRQSAIGGALVGRWDGTSWSTVPGAFAFSGMPARLFDMAAFDQGQGSFLFVAGEFNGIGNVPAQGMARWDGANWHAVDSDWSRVSRLLVFEGGDRPELFASGLGTTFGTSTEALRRWTGTTWVNPAPGWLGTARAVTRLPTLGTDQLHVGGYFYQSAAPTQIRSMLRLVYTGAVAVDFDLAGGSVTSFVPSKSPDWSGAWVGGSFGSSPAGDSFFTRYGVLAECYEIASAPGCSANQALLTASAANVKVGATTVFTLDAGPSQAGVGLYFLGQLSLTAEGCGIPWAPFGEQLLSAASPALWLGATPSTLGISELALDVPAVPALGGVSFTVQAVHVAPNSLQFPLLFSNALYGKLKG